MSAHDQNHPSHQTDGAHQDPSSQPQATGSPQDHGHGHGHEDAHIPIFINRTRYLLDDPTQTGAALKQLAGIALADVLYLQVPGGKDVIIANTASIRLKPGSHLFSQPAADYGNQTVDLCLPGEAIRLPQPDGWMFVILPKEELPPAFRPELVDILVKLPPNFPDAAPDMFWVRTPVTLQNGGDPQNTSIEVVLGERWQRFSWHLRPGAWQPGVSTFADFHRCIRARFERGN